MNSQGGEQFLKQFHAQLKVAENRAKEPWEKIEQVLSTVPIFDVKKTIVLQRLAHTERTVIKSLKHQNIVQPPSKEELMVRPLATAITNYKTVYRRKRNARGSSWPVFSYGSRASYVRITLTALGAFRIGKKQRLFSAV